MKHLTYETAKAELKNRHCSTKYFTKSWFKMEQEIREKVRKCTDEEWSDSLYCDADGIRKSHFHDPIFKTRFYNDNSSSYCEYLCIAC